MPERGRNRKDRPTNEQRRAVKDAAARLVTFFRECEGKSHFGKAEWNSGKYKDATGLSWSMFDRLLHGRFKTLSDDAHSKTFSTQECEEFISKWNRLRIDLRSHLLARLCGRRMRYLQWTEHPYDSSGQSELVWFDYPVTFSVRGLGVIAGEVEAQGRGLDFNKTFSVQLSGTLLHIVLTKVRTDIGKIDQVHEATATAHEEVGVRLFPWLDHWWKDLANDPRPVPDLDFAAGFGGWKAWSGRFVFSRALLIDEHLLLKAWSGQRISIRDADRGSREIPSAADTRGAWLPHCIDEWLHSEWERARSRNGHLHAFGVYAPPRFMPKQGVALDLCWA